MSDRAVLLLILLVALGGVAWAIFCAFLEPLLAHLAAAAEAAGHGARAAWEWAVTWVLVAVTAAGPLDADPESYAARAASVPVRPHHAKKGQHRA